MPAALLKVLMVEDNEADARLIAFELRRAGFELVLTRVETDEEYRAKLEPTPDVILCDYNLPQFDALRALQIVHDRAIDVPFLIISGSIGEETAVRAMQSGATDYLLKDRLGRLGAAINQALAQRQLREAAKRARQAEAEVTQRLNHALAATKIGVWDWDLRTNAIYWSPECQEIVGLKDYEGTPHAFRTVVHRDDFAKLERDVNAATEARQPLNVEFRINHPDGKIHWLLVSGRLDFDQDGSPKRLIGTAQDITARKHAESAIAASETRLREILDHMLEGCQILDFDYRYLYLNAKAGLHARRSPDTLIGKTMKEAYPGIEQTQIYQEITRCLTERRASQLENRFEFPDGSMGIFELRIQPAPEGILIFSNEITERKVAEASLKRSEARLKAAQRVAGLGVWDWDLKNGLWWSEELYRIYGLDPTTTRLDFDTYLNHLPDDTRMEIEAAIRNTVERDVPYRMEHRIRRGDGEERWVDTYGILQRDENLKPVRLWGVCHDIHERKQADEELRFGRQRLETLSRQLITTREAELRHLARELHDEIGQLLTAMKLNLRGIQRSVDPPLQGRLNENIAMIDQTVEQVRNLSLTMRPPHLDDLGLVATLHWYLKYQAKIAGFQDQLAVVPADIQVSAGLAIVCFRIAQEAVTNAVRHAAPQTIQIELRLEGTELTLLVRDDGRGFDVEHARRRAAAGGSLGLISMQERASLAGGKMEIESTIGEGTRIQAWFPMVQTP